MVRDWYVPHQRQLTGLNICKYIVRDWFVPHQLQHSKLNIYMVRDWYVPHQRQLIGLKISNYMVRDWYVPHQRQLTRLKICNYMVRVLTTECFYIYVTAHRCAGRLKRQVLVRDWYVPHQRQLTELKIKTNENMREHLPSSPYEVQMLPNHGTWTLSPRWFFFFFSP